MSREVGRGEDASGANGAERNARQGAKIADRARLGRAAPRTAFRGLRFFAGIWRTEAWTMYADRVIPA